MKQNKRAIVVFVIKLPLILTLVLSLLGCISFDKKPTRVELNIVAETGLNPDINGRPSPVVLRLYELKRGTVFQGADFFSLYGHENDLLNDDVAAREELGIKPGEVKQFKIELSSTSTSLGVLAAYRDIDNTEWKLVIPLELNRINAIRLDVQAKGLKAFRIE